MRNSRRKFLPPGYPAKPERFFYLAGLICSFMISLTGWSVYRSCYENLWEYTAWGERTPVLSGEPMPEFSVMFRGCFIGFEVLIPLSLVLILFHYRYFYQGSKSIYLMKRLPKAGELHRECLFLPIIMAAVCIICAAILLLAYYGIYLWLTPDQCMIPENFGDIWRALL